jgi:hypothetical protein
VTDSLGWWLKLLTDPLPTGAKPSVLALKVAHFPSHSGYPNKGVPLISVKPSSLVGCVGMEKTAMVLD